MNIKFRKANKGLIERVSKALVTLNPEKFGCPWEALRHGRGRRIGLNKLRRGECLALGTDPAWSTAEIWQNMLVVDEAFRGLIIIPSEGLVFERLDEYSGTRYNVRALTAADTKDFTDRAWGWETPSLEQKAA